MLNVELEKGEVQTREDFANQVGSLNTKCQEFLEIKKAY